MDEINYQQIAGYDSKKFLEKFGELFAKKDVAPDTIAPMLVLLDMIGRDTKITDIRWAAYMLATVMWETRKIRTYPNPAAKDPPVQGQKQTIRLWVSMEPADEVTTGRKRDYFEPVKVSKLPSGNARIVEKDGDIFEMTPSGTLIFRTDGKQPGATYGSKAVEVYTQDTGKELVFTGRGYTQLTWWENYAKAGVTIGRGLGLLHAPELASDAKISYEIMATCMTTGKAFANGKTFKKYFNGKDRKYHEARDMVNRYDRAEHRKTIAAFAKDFETILLHSRIDAAGLAGAMTTPTQ